MTVQPGETVADVARQTATDPEIDHVNEAIAFMTDVLAGDSDARQRMTDLLEQHDVDPLAEFPRCPPPWRF